MIVGFRAAVLDVWEAIPVFFFLVFPGFCFLFVPGCFSLVCGFRNCLCLAPERRHSEIGSMQVEWTGFDFSQHSIIVYQ